MYTKNLSVLFLIDSTDSDGGGDTNNDHISDDMEVFSRLGTLDRPLLQIVIMTGMLGSYLSHQNDQHLIDTGVWKYCEIHQWWRRQKWHDIMTQSSL